MSEHAVQQDEELKNHGEALQQAMPEPKLSEQDTSKEPKPAVGGTEKE